MNAPKIAALFALAAALIVTCAAAAGADVDNGIYGDLLGKYVRQGVVDYAGLKADEARLDAYLKLLEETDTASLSAKEQLAFYINAYNAWTLKLILGGYPGVKSIKELGSFLKSPWKKKIVRVDKRVISLDEVEHGILRPRFKDPRIHFAVNCASKSCPPLLSEPYRGATIDRQLDDATRAFLNDPKQNYLEGGILYVSSIFKWYSEDFNDDVVGFFLKYAEGDLKKTLAEGADLIQVRYLDYDWSLNGS
jgi:hypothetical protein